MPWRSQESWKAGVELEEGSMVGVAAFLVGPDVSLFISEQLHAFYQVSGKDRTIQDKFS